MADQITIRRAAETDIERIASINQAVFLGDRDSLESAQAWNLCWLNAFPLYQYFVIESAGEVVGYAGWQIHGGFRRAEPVIELDQLGIDKSYQGQKLAPRLIDECIAELVKWTQAHNTRIESHITFVVWGYAFNFNAMSAYAKQFGDGVCGLRTQFGNRAEYMLRLRRPIILQVKGDQQ